MLVVDVQTLQRHPRVQMLEHFFTSTLIHLLSICTPAHPLNPYLWTARRRWRALESTSAQTRLEEAPLQRPSCDTGRLSFPFCCPLLPSQHWGNPLRLEKRGTLTICLQKSPSFQGKQHKLPPKGCEFFYTTALKSYMSQHMWKWLPNGCSVQQEMKEFCCYCPLTLTV